MPGSRWSLGRPTATRVWPRPSNDFWVQGRLAAPAWSSTRSTGGIRTCGPPWRRFPMASSGRRESTTSTCCGTCWARTSLRCTRRASPCPGAVWVPAHRCMGGLPSAMARAVSCSRHTTLGRRRRCGPAAAEPALVKKLMDQGELPSLKALRDHGCWGEVRSPAAIGSGAVWPTFMTGEGPAVHGVYSVLPWDPRTMNLMRLTTDHLTPFWRGLSDAGYAVGVLDVPFAPVIGLAGGAEISVWGGPARGRGP